LKMLAEGAACLPARGMGCIAQQLAAPLLERGCIRFNTPAMTLLQEEGRVVGARLVGGEELRADAVVLAAPAPDAAQLSGLPMPPGAMQAVALYFGGAVPLYRSKKIVLNAAPDAFVNNAQHISNVAPSYAPGRRHLLSAVVLGVPEMSDEELFTRALADLRLMFISSRRAI